MKTIDRKELGSPDVFQSKAVSIVGFIQSNRNAVIVAVGMIMAAAAVFAGVATWKSMVAKKGSDELYGASKALSIALSKVDRGAADWNQKVSAELASVDQVATKYSSSKPGYEAALILGNIYFERGASKQAIEYYTKAVAAADSKSLKAVALHALAYAQERAQDYKGAVSSLHQVVAADIAGIKADAMLALARNYELSGDKPKASEFYGKVSKEFPNSNWGKSAEAENARLQSGK